MFHFFRLSGFRKQRSAARARPTIRRARLEVENLHARVVPSTSPVFINDDNNLQIDGTDGADFVAVSPDNVEVEVRYNDQEFRFALSSFGQIVFNGNGGNDFFLNTTTIGVLGDGGAGDDKIICGKGADDIQGGSGNDVIKGGGGADVLDGGADVDHVNGGGGRDDISGGSGNDDLKGMNGDDSLDGGDDNDLLRGGRGHDDLSGGDGDDDCDGGGGDDFIEGGAGVDDLRGGNGDDSCRGDEGDGIVNENELHAVLRSSGDIEGEAEFETEDGAATKFKVEIEDAIPNQTYSVFVDGVAGAVATLTTDAQGDARLIDFTPEFSAAEGTTVTVKDAGGNVVLEGTFNPGLEDDNTPDDGGNSGQDIELGAVLSSSGDIEGEAEFEIEDGSAKKFKVEIEDGTANQTYSVFLDDSSTAIATLTTDAKGDARVTLFNPSFTVNDGSTLQVKDGGGTVVLEGTFSPVLAD